MSNKILAVDDDEQVLRSIKRVLVDAGYDVITATSGPEALELIQRDPPVLIILDIIMPHMDGIEVCNRLRADPFYARIPIIFLTARGRPIDVATGLDNGADDYLVKPFEVIELPARIRALLRRTSGGVLDPEADTITVKNIQLSTHETRIQIHDREIELTPIEHRLLHYLMMHSGHPVSVEQLLENVWEYPPGIGDPKLVRVHVGNLRNKIEENPGNPEYLVNIRGRGYMIQN